MSEYHVKNSCNKCGSLAKIVRVIDTSEGYVNECSTVCSTCGFCDYWAYGYFESMADGYNACEKYYTED